jgi:hypothetical protein
MYFRIYPNLDYLNYKIQRLTDNRLIEIAALVNAKINEDVTTKRRINGKDGVLFALMEKQHAKLDLTRKAYQETLQNLLGY